jgi:hypothetical protein
MSKPRFDALGFPLNSVQKWAAWHDKRDREMAQETARRQARERAQTDAIATAELAQTRNVFEQRVATLEGELADLQQATTDIAGLLSGLFEDLAAEREHQAKAGRGELHDLKIEVAKLSSLLAEVRGADGFKFAREKEPVDLPAFLPPRREIN